MKGIVFVELMDHLENALGMDAVDEILDGLELSSGAAYTAVGTYDHREALAIIAATHEHTGLPVADLCKGFGQVLFHRLAATYPHHVTASEPLGLIRGIEHHIHAEVRKLYPDAELPTFQHEVVGEREVILIYSSSRPFGDICEGLIIGCFEHFGESVEIARTNLGGESNSVRFHLTHVPSDEPVLDSVG